MKLYGNNIDTNDAVEIAKKLKTNYSLTSLGLDINNDSKNKILKRNKDMVENERFVKTKNANS